MIGWILHALGRDPTVMNGAVMKNFVGADAPFASALVGGGDAFVSEVDESDGSIALYRPKVAVLNNITLDHKSLDELRHLFRDFAAKAETVVLNLDDDETRLLAAILPPERLVTYSFRDDSADLFGIGPRRSAVRNRLQGRRRATSASRSPAATMPKTRSPRSPPARRSACRSAEAAAALAGFTGLRRRFEKVGEANGVTVIDDFGHNPDKIAATLRTLHAFPGRLLLFFQPHGYGPLRAMKDELIATFAAGMTAGGRADHARSGLLWRHHRAQRRQRRHRRRQSPIAAAGPSISRTAPIAPTRLAALARPGDRIVVMGARDDTLTAFAEEIVTTLGV